MYVRRVITCNQSVEQFRDIVVAGQGVDLSAFADQGQGTAQGV